MWEKERQRWEEPKERQRETGDTHTHTHTHTQTHTQERKGQRKEGGERQRETERTTPPTPHPKEIQRKGVRRRSEIPGCTCKEKQKPKDPVTQEKEERGRNRANDWEDTTLERSLLELVGA